jgi:hypothetical protein
MTGIISKTPTGSVLGRKHGWRWAFPPFTLSFGLSLKLCSFRLNYALLHFFPHGVIALFLGALQPPDFVLKEN